MPLTAPSFYVTPTQRLGLRSLLPAFVLALVSLTAVRYALNHNHNGRFGIADGDTDDKDDPSQVDTIYLGGPDQAPTTRRPASGYNPVHPFKVIRLPRSGEGTGLIPPTPAGHLLYDWLAAFNNRDPLFAARALPTPRFPNAAAAAIDLRRQTGGFTLISAQEIEPGLLVFRLEDQNTPPKQVLGTLRLRPNTSPAAIASFSLAATP